MLSIFDSPTTVKYKSGNWIWDEENECIAFKPRQDIESKKERYITINTHKFLNEMKEEEELVFRQEFQRSKESDDSDVIKVIDIRNLALFLMPSNFISLKFVEFMHTKQVIKFLHALIIYFEYFIKFVEFLLIQRDYTLGKRAKIQSNDSVKQKRIFANYLSQYRLLVAREYSSILLGEGKMARFYHITAIPNLSATIHDKAFTEAFMDVSTCIVWIAHHRRCYDVINAEMSRLFCSDHFRLNRYEPNKFTPAYTGMLYGRKCRNVNYRYQNSPVVQELINVELADQPILWIGERLYRGNNKRIAALELEYIVPDSQLSTIDVTHGILGHTKKIYNTLLQLSWHAVRSENFNENNDPYHIVRQPEFKIPDIDEEIIHRESKHLENLYSLYYKHEHVTLEMIEKWLRRDAIIEQCKSQCIISDPWTRANSIVNQTKHVPNQERLLERYRRERDRYFKKKSAKK